MGNTVGDGIKTGRIQRASVAQGCDGVGDVSAKQAGSSRPDDLDGPRSQVLAKLGDDRRPDDVHGAKRKARRLRSSGRGFHPAEASRDDTAGHDVGDSGGVSFAPPEQSFRWWPPVRDLIPPGERAQVDRLDIACRRASIRADYLLLRYVAHYYTREQIQAAIATARDDHEPTKRHFAFCDELTDLGWVKREIVPWSAAYRPPVTPEPIVRTPEEEDALDAIIAERGDRTVGEWVAAKLAEMDDKTIHGTRSIASTVAARRAEFAIIHDRRGEVIPWVGEVREEQPAWHEGGSTVVHDVVGAGASTVTEAELACAWGVWADALDMEANPPSRRGGHRTVYHAPLTLAAVVAAKGRA